MWKQMHFMFSVPTSGGPPLSTSHWLESWVFYDVDHCEESQLKDSHQGPGNNEQFNGCEIYLTLLVKSRTQKLFSLVTVHCGNPFWKIAIRAGTGQTCQRIQLFLVLHEIDKHKHNSNTNMYNVHIRELIGNQSNQCWSNRRTRHTTGWWGFVRFTDSDFIADKISYFFWEILRP